MRRWVMENWYRISEYLNGEHKRSETLTAKRKARELLAKWATEKPRGWEWEGELAEGNSRIIIKVTRFTVDAIGRVYPLKVTDYAAMRDQALLEKAQKLGAAQSLRRG